MISYESQVQNLLKKCAIKREHNKKIIEYYKQKGNDLKAHQISECATYVGVTNINNIAHIVKSNFCRNRLCYICAWRRQAKFTAQMRPCLDMLANDGYRFIFVTLTMKNCCANEAADKVTEILKGYDRLLKKTKVKKAWLGAVRSVEMTYNENDKSFHPHIHMIVAVRKKYFCDTNLYIEQNELCDLWRSALKVNYTPICHIEIVKDKAKGALETIKYAIKPTEHFEALEVFDNALKNRRLVSFSGVIAQKRKDLKYSSIDDIDTIENVGNNCKLEYQLYKFDVTGGIYTYLKSYIMEE